MTRLRKPGQDETGDAPRRANGVLVSAVLNVLWEAGEPLSPAQVRERLAGQGEAGVGKLAHTTVVTILNRLHEKNALSRERDGRTFRYAPVADKVGMAAQRLSAVLDAMTDKQAVLSRFVEDLPDHDEQLLRAVLASRADQPSGDAGQG